MQHQPHQQPYGGGGRMSYRSSSPMFQHQQHDNNSNIETTSSYESWSYNSNGRGGGPRGGGGGAASHQHQHHHIIHSHSIDDDDMMMISQQQPSMVQQHHRRVSSGSGSERYNPFANSSTDASGSNTSERYNPFASSSTEQDTVNNSNDSERYNPFASSKKKKRGRLEAYPGSGGGSYPIQQQLSSEQLAAAVQAQLSYNSSGGGGGNNHWDSSDRHQFPIMEIQRIKNKTNKLRNSRPTTPVEAGSNVFRAEHSESSTAVVHSQPTWNSADQSKDNQTAPSQKTTSVSSFGESVRKPRNNGRQSSGGGRASPNSSSNNSDRDRPWLQDSQDGGAASSRGTADVASREDSLGDVLDRNYESSQASASGASGPPRTSRAAASAQRNLMRAFVSPGSSQKKNMKNRQQQRRSPSPPSSTSRLPPLPNAGSHGSASTRSSNNNKQRPPRATRSRSSSPAPTPQQQQQHQQRLQQEQRLHEQQKEFERHQQYLRSVSQDDDNLLQLHDLCGEAVSVDDVAWRNALYLLSAQPALAAVVDRNTTAGYSNSQDDDDNDYGQGGWTPLHICCMSTAPEFMIRALLLVHSAAARMPDNGGRLPLHLAAASAASVPVLQLLVDEYPAAVYQQDHAGLTPMHLLLRNPSIALTGTRVRILLGWTTTTTTAATGQQPGEQQTARGTAVQHHHQQQQQHHHHILLRRGEHLQLPLEELEAWRTRARPVTYFHHPVAHEEAFHQYPPDVQVALRHLATWKKRQKAEQHAAVGQEEVEVEFETAGATGATAMTAAGSTTNPAALPEPDSLRLPIHMLVQRGVIDCLPLETVLSSSSGGIGGKKKKTGSKDRDEDGEDDDDDEDTDDEDVDEIAMQESPLSVPHILETLRLFVAAYPEGLVQRDADGLTPLLLSMSKVDSLPSLDVIEILLGKRSGAVGYEPLPAWARDLSIHHHAGMDPGGPTALSRYQNPAMVSSSQTGQLPLHVAAEELLADSAIIESIHDSYPGAIHLQDDRGRTPLHLALNSYRRMPTDPRVLSVLFSDLVAQVPDDTGKIPFDLFLESAESLPTEMPRSFATSETASSADGSSRNRLGSAYQRFFNASIQGAARRGADSGDFLRRLALLPPWLRKEACSVGYVRELLVNEMAHPAKCAVILLEGMALVTLITVFRLQMKQYQDQAEQLEETGEASVILSWYTFCIYSVASSRLLILVIFSMLSASMSDFRRSYLLNPLFWVDAAGMVLVLLTSALLYGTWEEERMVALGTTSTCFLWLSLIGYLSTWWLGMAMFVGGFSKIMSLIFWAVIAVGALVIAGSQMFYTLLSTDCSDSIAVSSVCTAQDAYRVVYALLRGAPLVDLEQSEEMKADAIVLVSIFLFLLFLFSMTLLACTLLVAKRLDAEQIALECFWEPKLAFVMTSSELEVSSFAGSGRKRRSRKRGFYRSLARMWDLFTLPWIGGNPRKDKKWYARSVQSNHFAFLYGGLAVVIVPIWFVVGLASLGLLWPPQVRHWLFRPARAVGLNEEVHRESEQLYDVKREIAQLKQMSYEKSNGVERELRQLKAILALALKED